MVCRQSYAFQVHEKPTKCYFYSLFALFLVAVRFCIYTHARLKSWNFRILCIKNQRFAYRPYTSEENQNVVLFCNADKLSSVSTNKSRLYFSCFCCCFRMVQNTRVFVLQIVRTLLTSPLTTNERQVINFIQIWQVLKQSIVLNPTMTSIYSH